MKSRQTNVFFLSKEKVNTNCVVFFVSCVGTLVNSLLFCTNVGAESFKQCNCFTFMTFWFAIKEQNVFKTYLLQGMSTSKTDKFY